MPEPDKTKKPTPVSLEMVITNDFHQARQVEESIIATTSSYGYGEEIKFALRLSLEEALSNAIRHGNRGKADKKVHIAYQINSERIDIFVEDEGRGFDPGEVPDPTSKENLESPSGRGIMLMRAYMNKVEYNRQGNRVHLVKLNQSGQGKTAI